MIADYEPDSPGVLLDTTILIDVLRGDSRAVDLLNALTEPPMSSEICRLELLQGLRQHEFTAAHMLIDLIEWYPVVEPVTTLAGELGRRWRPSHSGIDAADLIVAATTQLTSARLATLNVRHFPMFEGLEAAY